jgi:hypothetical protein
MYIAQFLDTLTFGKHIEVIKATLPDMNRRSRVATAYNAPGESQFNRLHHHRRSCTVWFTD